MSDRPIPPDDVDELVGLARRLADRERLDEASELYLLALRLDPKNVGVKLGLGEIRKRQRQRHGGSSPRSLRGLVREQMRRASIDAAHFLGLAHIYAEKGENSRAVECLEVAAAKDPAHPGTYKLHGRILFRRKTYRRAAEELEKALLYNPFDRETAELLGRVLYECREMEEALRVSVHAFLLLHEGDREGTERVRRRIRTLRQILGWGRREITGTFRERQEFLHTAFDRLEWQRERFMEEEGLLAESLAEAPAAAGGAAGTGKIDLASRLRRLPLWSNLNDEQVFRLTAAVHEEHYEPGIVLFGHGDQGRDLYLLEEGRVTIERPTPYGTYTLGEIPPGGIVGEVNYVTLRERSAEAVAFEPSHLLRLDAGELDRIVEEDPDLGVQLFWCFWRSLAQKLRATNDQLQGFFAGEAAGENVLALRRAEENRSGRRVRVEPSDKIRLFREQGLSRSELMTLATFSGERRFDEGAYLFQEGDEGTEMYVVLEGRARISKHIPGAGEEALAILDRGDFFGEMSLIDGEPRSADARAHEGPLTVLVLDEPTVQEVLSMDSQASLEFLQLLCRLIAHRLREIDEKVIGWRILSGEVGTGTGSDESSSRTA
ncbi:MAG: cyclic nucleotide-binding domain-containing protein [Thermoanaerobaculia bacterium]